MQSSCRPVTFKLEGFWLLVACWACDCADHRHFQHAVDHGWPSCACFLPWLTLFICVAQFDFLGKCGNFLLPFTTATVGNIWWAVCIHQLELLAHISAGQVFFIALSCNSWTPVWRKTFKDLWKAGLYLSGKMPLFSDYFSKVSFNFWWEMLKQRMWVFHVESVFQQGFSFVPEHP